MRSEGVRGVIALVILALVCYFLRNDSYGWIWSGIITICLVASGFNIFDIPKLWEKKKDEAGSQSRD